MVCFSIIDLFGRWLNNPPNDDFGISAKNYFSQISNRDDLKNFDTYENFKDCYRHCVVHSFFAQLGYGLGYQDYNRGNLFTNIGNIKSLNVEYLLYVVKVGMDRLTEILKDEQSDIFKQLFLGYEYWIRKRDL
ncbi:hypothetical protein F0919_00720 [Taibaiella lutea]|uniref:Uncharacterized protein n=1 Tax=Taibaiella lutea TaxID=2608001 RepID=A0A5M6CLW7_9BACT|nr:hypothetical protein [Taibaiella lutea]KAA5536221.1 hypothetical protein F0919_00720 [Taibaiella lutea]